MRLLAIGLLLVFFIQAPFSRIEATPLRRAFDLQGSGLTLTVAGVGLQGWKGSARALPVKIDGQVELAVLYWAGRDRPCPEDPPGSGACAVPLEPYKDQVLTVDGTRVTGTLIGREVQPDANPGAIDNLGYMAEITDLVKAKGTGRQVFRIADGDTASNLADLDGAGLLLVTSVAGRPAARVIVFQGLDFAYGEDRSAGETRITEPIAFGHGAARVSSRRGEVAVLVGDALASAPDRVDIGHNASLADKLDGSAGAQWDADVFPVDVPAGVLSTTLQIASEPYGRNPDSLLWVMAALRLPLPVATGCAGSFWSGHAAAWTPTGIHADQLLRNTFAESASYGALGGVSMSAALRLRGGPDLQGAAKSLLSEAAAALLNASHPAVEYPLTRTQVITEVDTVLRGRDQTAIAELARQMEEWSGAAAGCPLTR